MVKVQYSRTILFLLKLVSLSLITNPVHAENEAVCAEVKIEIKQELTLERQGFDARMKINNALDSIPLEDVTILVNFYDRDGNSVVVSSDPNSTDAKFFIRIDSMEGVDSIEGGTVAAQSTADIHWLIIPAPGAAAGSVNGELYFVGANLSYTVGGELEKINVAPDFITVKPLPEITLDYFLTRFVEADDPLTEDIEATEPFTLGVRVQNNGTGLASNLKIESAQPKIVENEQGLLINFKIIGSTLNDQPSDPSLLIDFGDIVSGEASIGRWLMEATLAGEFTEFTASFTHADELGGELTSILTEPNTHLLVQDVLVDLPGRDGIRDFLANDNGEFKVYESDNVDTLVNKQSDTASLIYSSAEGSKILYTLIATASDGFSYIRLDDTFTGTKEILEVVRSDGKVLPLDNAWFSKERAGGGLFNYHFNLFDVQSTGSYSVVLGDKLDTPSAPNLLFIPDRTTHEGKLISFIIEASDPNDTIPVLTALNLPEGAELNDQGNGKAVFSWTPGIAQAGRYEITYQASDGELIGTRKAFVIVNPANDSDGDGMGDAWELAHFGTLIRAGMGDFDGDGISDLDEYEQNTNPESSNVFNFEISQTSVGSDWVDISLNAFLNPVVIAGVPSDNDSDAAVVRLRNLNSNGFKMRVQEWTYQDDYHALESVSYMAIEAGRHTLADGSIWEAGTFDVVSNQRWEPKQFVQPFAGIPQVYLTVQTTNDSNPVVIRAKNVSETGFDAALFEEEASTDHGREIIGYLAIYSPGTLNKIKISDVDYLANSSIKAIGSDAFLLTDGVTSLHLDEEQSNDDEKVHEIEDVAVLMINDAVFAQDNSSREADTIVIRRHSDELTVATPIISPAGNTISEAVTVSLNTVTKNALLYYTLDGSTPDPVNNEATQLYSVPFTVNATTTVKVLGKLDGYADSQESIAIYTWAENTPPHFIAVSDHTVTEENALSFVVQALDQNTLTQPLLSVDLSELTGTPVFVDNGDGSGRFSWIPPTGAAIAEAYTLNFLATDAQDSSLTTTTSIKILVTRGDILDSDGDGMTDEWEIQYSLDPNDATDAAADADQDGISNLDEYQQQSNPLITENIPPVAKIVTDVISGTAPLTVQFSGNTSIDSDGTITGYEWLSSDDNSNGSNVSFNHTFEEIGEYTVSLTVLDNSGSADTATVLIKVGDPDSLTVYEDAENGNTVGWHVYDQTPEGATFSNVYDSDKDSNVIELLGALTKNGYMLGNLENRTDAWNDTQNRQIQWSMKYDEDFVVYIRVNTTKGPRYLYYTALDIDKGMHLNGSYIHYGLGANANNSTWQTFARDLEADLKNFESDNELIAVNAFLIRGSGRVDDIEMGSGINIPDTTPPLLTLKGGSIIDIILGEQYLEAGATAIDYMDGERTVEISGTVDTSISGIYELTYTATDVAGNQSSVIRTIRVISPDGSIVREDAENGDTHGWRIYDQTPEGATFSNVYDNDKTSNVIQLQGAGTKNGYMLGNLENRADAWNDTDNSQILWSLKYDEDFVVYIRVNTSKGPRYLYYTARDEDKGMHSNGSYIHYGVGTNANNNSWQTFARDLVADLKNIESDNELQAVNAFLIRGSGRVDDIELGSNMNIPDTSAPVLKLNGESTIDIVLGEHYVEAGATAIDYVDGEITVEISGTVDTSVSGIYRLTYTATDIAENRSSTIRTVRVIASDGSIVHEDAENGDTQGWRVYDQTPEGAIFTNVYDTDKASNVIELQGAGTQNGYMLGNYENRADAWNDTQNRIIQWRMNYAENFVIYIRVSTTKGARYLYYSAIDEDRGMHSNGRYIHYGLGTDAKNGTWQTFTRNLTADLKNIESDNELIAVNAFLIRGSGRVDDIELVSP